MRIGIIDVDGHNYPNLCLMKLSAYHKGKGDSVEWWNENSIYDRVYMSKVFSSEYSDDIPDPQNTTEVIRGGTGYAITLKEGKEVYDKSKDPELPYEIEHIYPDYSIYPEYTKDTAYGRLTAGCPRGCGFCHVAPKEGKCSRKVADVNEFWNGQKRIVLSDPNILACKDFPDLYEQLKATGARIEFNQGLDARLITEDKAEMLANLNIRHDDLHFAMDSMTVVESVERGINRYKEAYKKIHGKWNYRYAQVFCLTNFDTNFKQDLYRVYTIKNSCECRPYIMIYNKPSAPHAIRQLQRYCNNVMFFSKYNTFEEYRYAEYKKYRSVKISCLNLLA